MKIDVLEALKDSGLKFKDNLVTALVLAAVPALLGILMTFGIIGIGGLSLLGGGGDTFGTGVVLLTFVLMVISTIAGVMIMNMAIMIHQGKTPEVMETLPKFDRFVQLILAAILVGLGTFLGTLLLVVPALIWVFLNIFTAYFILDGKSCTKGMKASWSVVWANKAQILVMYIVIIFINVIGMFIPLSELFIMPFEFILIAGYFVALSTGGESGSPELKVKNKSAQEELDELKAVVAENDAKEELAALKEKLGLEGVSENTKKTVHAVEEIVEDVTKDPAQTSAERMAALKAKIVADKQYK